MPVSILYNTRMYLATSFKLTTLAPLNKIQSFVLKNSQWESGGPWDANIKIIVLILYIKLGKPYNYF